MPTVEGSGTQLATGGEDTLFTSTSQRAFILTIDLSAMQGGDTLVVRGYVKATNGGTLLKGLEQSFSGVQSDPDKLQVTIPIPSPWQVSYRIAQTAGTNRSYPWNVASICDVTPELTGTQATTNAEATIGADIITNRTCVLITDHSLQPVSGSVTLRLKEPALTAGTVQTLFSSTTTAGVPVDPASILISPPVSAPDRFRATVQRITGADYNMGYTICSLSAA